jgi:hypothetical protein
MKVGFCVTIAILAEWKILCPKKIYASTSFLESYAG